MSTAALTYAERLELWQVLHTARPYTFQGGLGTMLRAALPAGAAYWEQHGLVTRVAVPLISAAGRKARIGQTTWRFLSPAQRAQIQALLTVASELPGAQVQFSENLAAHWRRLATGSGNPFIPPAQMRRARAELVTLLTVPAAPDEHALHDLTPERAEARAAILCQQLHLSLTHDPQAGYRLWPTPAAVPATLFPRLTATPGRQAWPRLAIERWLDAAHRPDTDRVRRGLSALPTAVTGQQVETARRGARNLHCPAPRQALAHCFGLISDAEYLGATQRVRQWYDYASGVIRRVQLSHAEGLLTASQYQAEQARLQAEGLWPAPDSPAPLDWWAGYLGNPADPDYRHWAALAHAVLTPDELHQLRQAGLRPDITR